MPLLYPIVGHIIPNRHGGQVGSLEVILGWSPWMSVGKGLDLDEYQVSRILETGSWVFVGKDRRDGKFYTRYAVSEEALAEKLRRSQRGAK